MTTTGPATELDVAADYDRWADEYAARFAAVEVANPLDRALVDHFAELVGRTEGKRVLDLGCGPGHWSGHLAEAGLRVTGIDLSPSLLAHARDTQMGPAFVRASMGRLPVADASVDGVLAWFSLIHTPPARLPLLLEEMARVLVPGGRALVGFVVPDDEVDQVEPFDHRVTRAWRWPLEELAEALQRVGLEVTARATREPDPDERRRSGSLVVSRRRSAPGR